MKVRELIEILSKQDADTDVFLEYDTMCCVYNDFVIAKVTSHEKYYDGIYLMCENTEMAKYLFNNKGHIFSILHGVE
jgi:hypothetical protein